MARVCTTTDSDKIEQDANLIDLIFIDPQTPGAAFKMALPHDNTIYDVISLRHLLDVRICVCLQKD
ncbi:MAG: hypothetical protein NXI12_08380 [Alphaproteobacteria bacterium]|nr:hypothetical protein [Alphaproteobacteria bacterium]